MRAPARASTPRTATSTTTASRPASTDGSRAPRSIAPNGAPACGSLLWVRSVIGDRPLRGSWRMGSGTACESYHKRSASAQTLSGTTASGPSRRRRQTRRARMTQMVRAMISRSSTGRPVDEVLQVVAQLVLGVGVVAPVDLGQAGQARWHLVPSGVPGDLLLEALGELGALRARADDRHPAGDDVQDLRQLVGPGGAHPAAGGDDARVALGRRAGPPRRTRRRGAWCGT